VFRARTDRRLRVACRLAVEHFVCDGTFDALLRVRLDFEMGATERMWSIVSGTGVN